MVRRRAANDVGDTSALKTGSSLYSRMGMTHMSTPYWRMSWGRAFSTRSASHACWRFACSRRGPKGRSGAGDFASAVVAAGACADGATVAQEVESSSGASNRVRVRMAEQSVTQGNAARVDFARHPTHGPREAGDSGTRGAAINSPASGHARTGRVIHAARREKPGFVGRLLTTTRGSRVEFIDAHAHALHTARLGAGVAS